jgi:aspartyl/glutamyl-tRNA(Asn/Gln) amidotransferase C subunit
MEINCDTIKHLANLSNFSVSDTESKSLEKDLSEILKYISQLEEIDVENVEPTYQVFEMENVWRNDEILEQDATREELLALTREQKDNQIKVPKVL